MKRAPSMLVVLSVLLASPSGIRAERQMPFKGFTSYGTKFKELCEAIKEDGRLPTLVQILKEHGERDKTCESCKPLMTTFAQSCSPLLRAPKKDKKDKKAAEDAASEEGPKEEATPTPIPPQREPSLLVVDRASKLGIAIAEDKIINVRSLPAIKKLIFILRNRPSMKSQAEAEYYDTVAEYFFDPFIRLEEEIAKEAPHDAKKEGAVNPEDHKKTVDSLFEE